MKFRITSISISFILTFLTSPLMAKYGSPQLREVPALRLIKNLEKKHHRQPNDLQLLHQLARAHAVASVQETVLLDPSSDHIGYGGLFDKSQIPWGHNQSEEPLALWRIVIPNSKKNHLETAIQFYDKAIALDPHNMVYFLGRGWCNLKLKKDQQAKVDFLRVIEKSWDSEKSKSFISNLEGVTWSLVVESADYLRPLLDPKKEAELISDIDKKISMIRKNGREGTLSPIIFPLDKSASFQNLIYPKRFVTFDLDGWGPDKWSWPSPRSGFLVYLGLGRDWSAMSGRQLFGNITFSNIWKNGYDALSSLDDDENGILEKNELLGIFVWRDQNSDGMVTPNEVLTLRSLGIAGISTRHGRHNTGIEFSPAGVILEDGTKLPSYDWISTRQK